MMPFYCSSKSVQSATVNRCADRFTNSAREAFNFNGRGSLLSLQGRRGWSCCHSFPITFALPVRGGARRQADVLVKDSCPRHPRKVRRFAALLLHPGRSKLARCG